jgi:hypothetical protein
MMTREKLKAKWTTLQPHEWRDFFNEALDEIDRMNKALDVGLDALIMHDDNRPAMCKCGQCKVLRKMMETAGRKGG